MCGIVGYNGNGQAKDFLLDGLKKLEYRGYDSAGLAIQKPKSIELIRASGKLIELEKKLKSKKQIGSVGIGHTRWATHGAPTVKNAHPHHAGDIALVHNGIIENVDQLKKKLPQKGRELKSDTDTEVLAHLLNHYAKKQADFKKALIKLLDQIEGSYALAILYHKQPHQIFAAKKASPLVIGLDNTNQQSFVASDISAIIEYTNSILFLEDDELAVLAKDKVEVFNSSLKKIKRRFKKVNLTQKAAQKGGYKHFMLKEIMEQPEAILETVRPRIDLKKNQLVFPELKNLIKKRFPFFNRFYIVACGTSWHAAKIGRYYMEAIAKTSAVVDTASEFRYREPIIDEKTLVLVISQSGETADTVASVVMAKQKKAKVIALCNVVDSQIARLADATLYTYAGPEISVASTKAFTTQVALLLMLALYFGTLNKSVDKTYLHHALHGLKNLPNLFRRVLKKKDEFLKIAEKHHLSRDFYFIARGVHFPVALEAALKLKEISYIHAEGYAAGEMKHGPIAMIEPGIPVLAIAPKDRVCQKMIANIEEVKARGALMIVVATEKDKRFLKLADHIIYLPKTLWYLSPIISVLPLQFLAYYIADFRGADIDRPRNLAKSVTVE